MPRPEPFPEPPGPPPAADRSPRDVAEVLTEWLRRHGYVITTTEAGPRIVHATLDDGARDATVGDLRRTMEGGRDTTEGVAP